MLRWKSSLKPAAAASGLQTPTLLGIRNPTGTSSSSTSIDISSATQGALLLASVTARSTQGNLSAPTEGGWTLLASVDNGSSSTRPLNRVYYKTAGASESTVTWTHDADYTSAVAIEIVGADTSTLAVTTNQSSPILGVVTVPTNGFVIAVHAKGASGDTSSSTVRLADGVTDQTQYTTLGDAYGTKRSGTFMAVGDVGAGDTNGTDKIVGAGNGSSSATHHIAIKPSGATSYKATVLADNPLFYYRLGEASGTDAYDEVAAANNGMYYNTPDLGETGAISGDSNTAVKFKEASSEYAETVTLSSETSLLPCTIESFVKTDGASDSNAGIVMIRGTTPASGLNIKGSTLGKLGYHWNNASSSWGYSGGPTLSDDTWYYVALVIESTKTTFYVIDESGTLTTVVNTATNSAINVSSNGWNIGRDYGYAGRSFQGTIDEVAIYDQALSQSTVVAHAAAAGYTS